MDTSTSKQQKLDEPPPYEDGIAPRYQGVTATDMILKGSRNERLNEKSTKYHQSFESSNFDINAIIRGAQLTIFDIIPAVRALQNPDLFRAEHYRQAVIAVAIGIIIRLIVAAPILVTKVSIWLLSFLINLETATWDDKIIASLDFIGTSVLQIPFFVMTLMRYLTPTLDNIFMDSLRWVDETYVQKHETEDSASLRAPYFAPLSQYSTCSSPHPSSRERHAIKTFLVRYAKRTAVAFLIYVLSFMPLLGRFVLPAASVYTFNNAVGPLPAAIVFGAGLILPKTYIVMFLQSYYSSRSLMRELLIPYFSRIRFSPEQKRQWFRDREGLLFGFSVGFYIILKIPLLGVLIYGIAEASTAYLITKITDPPPLPADVEGFAERQTKWTNKFQFLHLPLSSLDSAVSKASPTKQETVKS